MRLQELDEMMDLEMLEMYCEKYGTRVTLIAISAGISPPTLQRRVKELREKLNLV